jgi:hypothetical protein
VNAVLVAMAQHNIENNFDFQNSKIPPGWDGVSKSLQQYLEELEDWLGYTELIDKPERIGPTMKSRLSGKPKLISKMLSASELTQTAQEASRNVSARTAGYILLKEKLIEKLKDDDADFKWVEIKRFQKLSKAPYESFREFIPMFEVAYARAQQAGFELGGDGLTFALFDACNLTSEQRAHVLTHTQSSHNFDLVSAAMRRVLDPAQASVSRKETDEIRRRGNAAMSNPRSHSMYLTEQTGSEQVPFEFGNGESHDVFQVEESSDQSSVYSVSNDDREEFVALYTQHKAVNKSMKKFKRPYRPTQSKKRWMQAGSNTPHHDRSNFSKAPVPPPRKLYFLDEHGTYQEADEEIMFASFARKSTPGSSSSGRGFKPSSRSAKPGKNPIDRKTGERMTCFKCNSVDHLERACTSTTKTNFMVTEDVLYVDEEVSEPELGVTL